MKGAPGGFTIVEVMIVLAISAVMLTSAIAVFSGRRESTDFTQAVYDLQSQIQSIAAGVSSQAVPGLQQFTCAPATINGVMRPALTTGSATGQDCIYLGQAIQVVPDKPDIYSYPIFGLRTVYDASGNTGEAPTTVADAHPEPAVDSADPTNPAKLLLINDYPMLNGLQTVSASYGGAENDILTIYSQLQDSNTSGNEISVAAMNYQTGGALTDTKAQLKACIEASSDCTASTSLSGSPWLLCVSDGNRQAQLSLKPTATGITTTLNMTGCS